jgi:hypothetical protein
MAEIEYLARCHCGALTARYRTALGPAAWSVRACQCSFCRGHGAITTSDPSGSLAFCFEDPMRVSRYRFGVRTADFLICRECGMYLGAQMARFGILNVLTLRALTTHLPPAEPMDYGAETAEVRRTRREVRWTPLISSL